MCLPIALTRSPCPKRDVMFTATAERNRQSFAAKLMGKKAMAPRRAALPSRLAAAWLLSGIVVGARPDIALARGCAGTGAGAGRAVVPHHRSSANAGTVRSCTTGAIRCRRVAGWTIIGAGFALARLGERSAGRKRQNAG